MTEDSDTISLPLRLCEPSPSLWLEGWPLFNVEDCDQTMQPTRISNEKGLWGVRADALRSERVEICTASESVQGRISDSG